MWYRQQKDARGRRKWNTSTRISLVSRSNQQRGISLWSQPHHQETLDHSCPLRGRVKNNPACKQFLFHFHPICSFKVRELSVVLGDHDRDSIDRSAEIVTRNIRRVRKHEHFNSDTFNNDIAILELDEPVLFDSMVRPVCMPTSCKWKKKLPLTRGSNPWPLVR